MPKQKLVLETAKGTTIVIKSNGDGKPTCEVNPKDMEAVRQGKVLSSSDCKLAVKDVKAYAKQAIGDEEYAQKVYTLIAGEENGAAADGDDYPNIVYGAPTPEKLTSSKMEKKMKKITKEGGKRGVEIEGAADMGGLQFFCTTMDEPAGDVDLLYESLKAMNAKSDPSEEERKGGSGRIGKMLISKDLEDSKMALVAYCPPSKHKELKADQWMKDLLANLGGGDLLFGDAYTAKAELKNDPDKGLFVLKLKDSAISESINYLKSKGLFPDKVDDSDDDEYVFGDDDFPNADDEEAAEEAEAEEEQAEEAEAEEEADAEAYPDIVYGAETPERLSSNKMEKKLKKITKEGGKRGVEIEGAADMGGLQFFCTTLEEPNGDVDLLYESLKAMNAKSDPSEEERKGGSGRIGKMLVSKDLEDSKIALVAYCPPAKHKELTAEQWMKDLLAQLGGGDILFSDAYTAKAELKNDPDKGLFVLKLKDSAISESINYLKSKGLFPDKVEDSDDDEYVFGDDDFPNADDEEAAEDAEDAEAEAEEEAEEAADDADEAEEGADAYPDIVYGAEPPERLTSNKMEKKLKKIVKEGGKRGVEIEGAADMGGLQFFCTTMDEPAGDVDLLYESLKAMNAKSDPSEEERKGGSGRIGKMLISKDLEDSKMALVAYCPPAKHGELTADQWMKDLLKTLGGGEVLFSDAYTAKAELKNDADKGLFVLKLKDSAISESINYLKSKGLFPDKVDDSDDEFVFGDDDFPSADVEEAADEDAEDGEAEAEAEEAADAEADEEEAEPYPEIEYGAPTPEKLTSSKMEKKMKKIIKEGGKRGVEIEGAADMGGLQFFCTTMEEPNGDVDLLYESMKAMNAKSDPSEEERKGGSGRIGKMLISKDLEDSKLALVAYCPPSKHEELTAEQWMKDILEALGGGEMEFGDAYTAKGVITNDADKGLFVLKLKDSAITESINYLKSKGLFPDKTDDSDDEMVFGDDDFPSM